MASDLELHCLHTTHTSKIRPSSHLHGRNTCSIEQMRYFKLFHEAFVVGTHSKSLMDTRSLIRVFDEHYISSQGSNILSAGGGGGGV